MKKETMANPTKRKSPMKTSRLLLLVVLVFGVAIEGGIGSDGDHWYEALVGYTWRF